MAVDLFEIEKRFVCGLPTPFSLEGLSKERRERVLANPYAVFRLTDFEAMRDEIQALRAEIESQKDELDGYRPPAKDVTHGG